MFEISGNDISSLGDADLRSLVFRLATAELRAKAYPLSSITAGGDQDAADGGLDARIECPRDLITPDFVPRRLTGFQVKKPDMRAAAITKEMRPDGVLRDVIRELANGAGAYVIVSGRASVTDKGLVTRRKAMREALSDLPNSAQLHTDFYDRDRIATWVNQYPGIAVWVRSTIGRSLSGWSGIGDWGGRGQGDLKPYLVDDNACLIDANSRESKHLIIPEGITRLRTALRTPRQCIRLIGLSGVGKTRLVQALFEPNVGSDPLDPSLAIYTDYSTATTPTARDMARDFIASRQRAILIVDNCNPNTHSELARLCASDASEVSLITVEYDVRDDEPEQTDVFRLESASRELVAEWIKQSFPHVSQVDRKRIAEFSDGNFRVAGALAQTLRKDETLGSLKNRELLERIFRQRNELDQHLLRVAEDLSLLYSIDGEDVSAEGELARLGVISGISARQLYEALVQMRQRGVVQARGRFRAVLPQAIANTLAAHALERIPPADFDRFSAGLPDRMLKSVSRRLGFLHDSPIAQSTVTRWLQADGPLGDLIAVERGFRIITNIAPVAPEAVLAKLERDLAGLPSGAARLKHDWVSLIKALGYDAHLFDRVVDLLARFAGADPENNNLSSARNTFSGFFHIYLSGTQASPEQRRSAIRRFAASRDENLRRSADIALRAFLQSGHFVSTSSHDFGARPRDWGWHPALGKDISDWFESAIALVLELSPDADARAVLADNIRQLWHYPACRDALDRAATVFLQRRPWIEGWIACRASLRYDGKNMSDNVRAKLAEMIERLKLSDLLNQARAVVLNRMPGGGGWDFADGEDDEGEVIKAWEKADKMAQDVGRWLANDDATRAEFLPELFARPHPMRASECGRGLAEGADDLKSMWLELASFFRAADAGTRDARALGGFVHAAHKRDCSFTSAALEAVIENPDLAPFLPYFQTCVGIDTDGIERLRRAIAKGVLTAANFQYIANGSVAQSPPDDLAALLEDIATLSGGVEIALDVLHMHFYANGEQKDNHNARLVSLGRGLLVRADLSKARDYAAHTLIRICLAGNEGRRDATKICHTLRSAIDGYQIFPHDFQFILTALFETQPFTALDAFLLPTPSHRIRPLFDADFVGPSLEKLDPAVLEAWANGDPDVRYASLGRCISMFRKRDHEEGNEISPLFLSMLDKAPDKRLFLGELQDRFHPGSWSGSLAHILEQRKSQLTKLTEHPDAEVRAWAREVAPELDPWIEIERVRDRALEQSFE
jgi:hypothetical protein